MSILRRAWSSLPVRYRRWIVVLGVLLAVRAALPWVLRPLLAARASEALHARVDIGGIDLALWRGGITLRDVAVRAAGAEPNAEEAPLVSWKRFAVAVRWLPLVHRTIQLRELELESPRIALDRLESGELNLMALMAPAPSPSSPAPEPTPASPVPTPVAGAASPAPRSAPGWGFGVDRLVLRDGGVRFRDFLVRDAEPVEVTVDAIEVADVAIRPGLYGEPARLHLGAKVDQGKVRVDARLSLREDGVGLETDLRARRLPLRRSRVYLPRVGWRDLGGELTAALAHRFETGVRNDVRGRIALHDLSVQVPALEEPALAWRELAVHVDSLDLRAQRVALGAVALNGASLLVRAQPGVSLPLLPSAASPPQSKADAEPPSMPAPAATESAPRAATEPAPRAASESREAKPWRWSVASLTVADSRLRVLASEAPLDVGVSVDAHALAGDGTAPAPVRLGLAVGDGSLVVDGSVRLAPPGFEGQVTIERLPLPDLAGAASLMPPHVLQTGRLGAELAIAAGTDAAPGDVRVHGKLSLAELWLAAADPNESAIGARSIDLAIGDLTAPGLLGSAPDAAAKPISVRIQELQVAAPYVQLTRTADGLLLPGIARPPPSTEAVPSPRAPTPPDSATASDAASLGSATAPGSAPAPPPPQPVSAPPATAAPRVEVALDALRVTQGRVGVTDRTVKPFYAGALTALDLEVRELRWPVLAMRRLHLEATSAERGHIEVTGTLAPEGTGRIDVNGRRIALRPFNPYATTFSSYSIARGALSVTTTATFGNGRYDARTSVTLHDFDVASRAGESLFQEQFGIPLSMGLALLRDVRGDIALEVPVEADREGTKIGLLTVVGGALRRALLNALASPLKLVGAVLHGDKVEAVAPAPIAFRAGRAVLAPAGVDQVEQLAAFLAARPGTGVRLLAAPSTQDLRWLNEQALREELTAPQGILGTVKNLRQRGPRERIRVALEARARDESGDLDAADAEALEHWLAERPPVPAERLRDLAVSRVERIEVLLRDQHGVATERVTRGEPAAGPTEDPPAVRFEIGPVGAPPSH